MVCLSPEGNWSRRLTVVQMMEFVVLSKVGEDQIDLVGAELMFEDGSGVQETVS